MTSREVTKMYKVIGFLLLPMLVLATLIASLRGNNADVLKSIAGDWLIYDGVGTQVVTLEESSGEPVDSIASEALSAAFLRGHALTIFYDGQQFKGKRVRVDDVDLPRGLSGAVVEEIYQGTIGRPGSGEDSHVVVVIRLSPDWRTIGLFGAPPPTAPAPPTRQESSPVDTGIEASLSETPAGRIAFHSSQGGSLDIYTINTDGTGLLQLTESPAVDYLPSWSPDGRQIAFISRRGRDEGDDVFIISADGSEIRRVTEMLGFKGQPAWSPDGTRLVFSNGLLGPGPLYVVHVDGSGLTQLTDFTAFSPDWSPDGNWLAFSCPDMGLTQICVMSADGRNLRRLTSAEDDSRGPVWSPDGGHIAFVRGNAIHTMEQDGSNVSAITGNLGTYPAPAWSSDGKHIAFVSNKNGSTGIYIMSADGSQQYRVTDITIQAFAPDWMPNLP